MVALKENKAKQRISLAIVSLYLHEASKSPSNSQDDTTNMSVSTKMKYRNYTWVHKNTHPLKPKISWTSRLLVI